MTLPSSITRTLQILTLLGLVALGLVTVQAKGDHSGLLEVTVLDVGQGDAIFIEAPNGNQVLIDGGPDADILSKLGKLMPASDRSIDLVIVSHPHSDHLAGLNDVIQRYEVGQVVQAAETYDSALFRNWTANLAAKHVPVTEALAGTAFDLGDGISLTLLYPFKSFQGTELKNPHEADVVAMLRWGSAEVLLTGDMETKVEQSLIDTGLDLEADVLKVGHHGSKTSSSEAFLKAVHPQLAVISVGAKNLYHHPSPETLARLENFHIPYYRTDVQGDIQLETDGHFIRLIQH